MSKLKNQSSVRVAEAAAYAGLIADICKLTPRDSRHEGALACDVFRRLGWEVKTDHGRLGAVIRRPGVSHWQSMPRILYDFGTAVHYTIGHRYGKLDDLLEKNWYIKEMCEVSEIVDMTGGRMAAWAVRLGKLNKTAVDATAITPAAALVAAYLRTHT